MRMEPPWEDSFSLHRRLYREKEQGYHSHAHSKHSILQLVMTNQWNFLWHINSNMDSPSPQSARDKYLFFISYTVCSVVNKNRHTAQSCTHCICYFSGSTEQSILLSLLCLALDQGLNHPYQLICWLFALRMTFVSACSYFFYHIFYFLNLGIYFLDVNVNKQHKVFF